MDRTHRPHWTDAIADGSLVDVLKQRLGVDPLADARIRRAADPRFHPECHTKPARGVGRPPEDVFNSCVVATADLVAELQGTARHDWQTVTLALVYPGNWGPDGWRTAFQGTHRERAILRREVAHFCERIEEAYRREVRRRASEIKRFNSQPKRLKASAKRLKTF
jgi:hypothetical protein